MNIDRFNELAGKVRSLREAAHQARAEYDSARTKVLETMDDLQNAETDMSKFFAEAVSGDSPLSQPIHF